MVDVERIFKMYGNDVFRLAYSYTNSRQDAEDISQTVFLKLMEQKHIQKNKEKSWLLKTTANACRNLLKSSWWKKTAPMDEALAIASTESGDTLSAVMRLEWKYRCVLYLYYYEGYTTYEIGKLLKITQSAVTTRLARGRERLKSELQEV